MKFIVLFYNLRGSLKIRKVEEVKLGRFELDDTIR